MISQSFRRFSGTILLSGIGIAVIVVSSLVFLRMGGSHQGVTIDPRLILGPNPASPGSVVTVSGFDFPSSKGVKVYFQDPAHGVVNATTNGGGFFNADMKLPDQISEGSRVYAVSGSVTSFIPLHVMKPSLTALNTPSSLNGTVLINGNGFLANEPVTLTLSHGSSNIHKSTVMANQQGQIQSSVAVTDTQDTLVASDPANNTASVNLSASPNAIPHSHPTSIVFSSRSGCSGQTIRVSGLNAGDSESLVLQSSRSNSSSVGQSLGSTTSGTTQFTVPQDARGTYTIVIIDQTTGTSSVYRFNILPFCR